MGKGGKGGNKGNNPPADKKAAAGGGTTKGAESKTETKPQATKGGKKENNLRQWKFIPDEPINLSMKCQKHTKWINFPYETTSTCSK